MIQSSYWREKNLDNCKTFKIKFLLKNLQMKVSQPNHPWCKKSCSQEFKKGHAEKDVKSKWAAKASCC